MGNLHVHFYHGNVKAFRQELDGSGGQNTNVATGTSGSGSKMGGGVGSGSVGKSWTMSGLTSVPVKADPNDRDQYGRTVLHLAASSTTQQAYTFFSILLRNPNIFVNFQDYESGYTALHRALFGGNIRAARDLLARGDIDMSIKDAEGLTAFDLYNGTVDGTNPQHDSGGADLYVWGVNRNFTLGTGDTTDKAFPDRVSLLTQSQASSEPDPTQRFHHIGVRDVAMAKLHTGVVTSESRGNLSLCGFGSNGRLGRSVHSQLSLHPLADLPHTITSISLGQDHTLALTSGGYILSWGHNRFSQLGYVIEPPENAPPSRGISRDDDQIQVSPRRIVGPLKKEWVKGVAAGRMCSACWTADIVWTWGTNAGQLGYEKSVNPVQVLPRKVTAISQTVVDIAFSDYAMICLLDSYEVVCFHHDTNFKITFSTPRPPDAFPFRPAQATLKPMIKKVTSCGTTFAALSTIGDVFTFSLPNTAEDVSKDARDRHVTVKPQLIWALRKSFTAVKDVALGSDGTVIICTYSGHVFVRQRVKSGAGQLKFRRIPYLQRAIKVACNESGAFAAIRVDAKATAIDLNGRTLEQDMALLQPHFRRYEHQMTAEDFDRETRNAKTNEEDEEEPINSVAKDMAVAIRLCTILRRWRTDNNDSLFSWSEPSLGSDINVVVGDVSIPAHSTILTLRSTALGRLLKGTGKVEGCKLVRGQSLTVQVNVCHPLVVLLLLQYIYTDDVAAIWDVRVARELQDKFPDLGLPIAQVKLDLKNLAEALDFGPLVTVLNSATGVPVPTRTLPRDLQAFFNKASIVQPPLPSCDLTLVLSDKEVFCSSILLRARCLFFDAMFADHDWTANRHEKGNVVVQMQHLKWRPMKMVFKYIHEGLEDDLFDYMHQETLDEFLDFVFEVLAAATELLLDRLVLVCSRIIIRHCNAYNAAALACEAAFYQATILKVSIFDYIISCMESMLESGLLDDMHEDVMLDLCSVIAEKQGRKLSVSRSGILVNPAMEKYKEWLAVQDIPSPRIRYPVKWKSRSPIVMPVDTTPTKKGNRSTPSPITSPEIRPLFSSTNDDIFTMDDDIATPPPIISGAQTPKVVSRPMTPFDLSSSQGKGAVWKSKTVETEKVDLRSVMAEAAASSKTPARASASAQMVRTPSSAVHRPSSASSNVSTTPSKCPGLARSPPSSAGPSTGPWRTLTTAKPSPASVQAQQSAMTQTRPSGSQASPIPQRTGAGKVITPMKLQSPPTAVQRKSSQGAAWTTTSTFAPAPVPMSVSPDSKSFSLLAIQQEEQDYANQWSKKPVKSFADIQAEERQAEESKAQEQEFMRWWEEEQTKVAKESGGGASAHGGRGGRGGRGRGGRGGQRKVPPHPGSGGGRGGAGGGTGQTQGRGGSTSAGRGGTKSEVVRQQAVSGRS